MDFETKTVDFSGIFSGSLKQKQWIFRDFLVDLKWISVHLQNEVSGSLKQRTVDFSCFEWIFSSEVDFADLCWIL